MDQNKQPQQPQTSFSNSKNLVTRKRFTLRRAGLVTGFVLMAGIVSIFLFNIFNDHTERSTASQVRSVFSDNEIREYTSPEHNFKIRLPGFPVVTEEVSTESGQEIPITIYERRVEESGNTYKIVLSDYSGKQFDKNTILETKFTQLIQSVDSPNLISKKAIIYEGGAGLEAVYSYPDPGNPSKPHSTFVRLLEKDSKIYMLSLNGADQKVFDEYVGSFKFN